MNGREYVAVVRATNMAGLSSEAKSDGFVYDKTMPITGEILVRFQGIRNVTARYCKMPYKNIFSFPKKVGYARISMVGS